MLKIIIYLPVFFKSLLFFPGYRTGWLFIFLITIVSTAHAYQDEEIIEIRGFKYGRLKLAIEIEKNPRTDKKQLKKIVEVLNKNLLLSGVFDIQSNYDDIDLSLKLRFIPYHEIRAWIFTPDGTQLYDHSKSLKGVKDFQPVVLKMVEKIIFQLTGEKSILRSAIVYVEKNANSQYKLVMTDPFGEIRKVVLNDNKYNILPRWNPDASSILFTTLDNRGSKLRQLILETGEVATLFSKMGKLSGGTWGADGNELMFTQSEEGNSDIFKVKIKDSAVSRMTFRSSTEANPRLSPDGKRLLFVSNRSGSIQIYQRILETGETFRMTFEGYNNYEPNWSNDGAYIVFSGIKDKRFQIFMMDRDGEFVQQVTYGDTSAEQPIWSPNGRQILFVAKKNYTQKLYIIRVDGTLRRRLTRSGPEINEFNPTWTAKYQWPQNQ